MTADSMEQDFRDKVSEEIRISSEGLARYRVFTPFLFEDGDHLAVVLRQDNGSWVLSDEGHTYMHLSYDLDERDLQSGTRQRIISNALAAFRVEDRKGELVLPVPGNQYGDALYSFVQALLKISDVTYLSRERVRSTFLDDFKAFMLTNLSSERLSFDWNDESQDPEGKYLVDCRVNGSARPLFVYALPSDAGVRDATIALLQFEKWGLPFRSLAIFEDQVEVNRKVLARFTDVCEKLFSSLHGNEDRILQYLSEAVPIDI